MKHLILAVAEKGESWIEQGIANYLKRFPSHWSVDIKLLKPSSAMTAEQKKQQEAQQLLAHLPSGYCIIALDERGLSLNTVQWKERLEHWSFNYKGCCWCIGGADGLSDVIKSKAHLSLRLSDLTFPHALVRILLVEQLYRIYTLQQGHPYHRH